MAKTINIDQTYICAIKGRSILDNITFNSKHSSLCKLKKTKYTVS